MTVVRELLLRIADQLETSKDELNRLDAHAGDGDLGLTATRIAQAIRTVIDTSESRVPEILGECGREIARQAPSSCGTLIATALLSAASVVDQEDEPLKQLADGLSAATTAVADRGRVSVGQRTMLDALSPASSAADRAWQADLSIEEALADVASAAEGGAAATKSMEAKVGRAGWLSERATGHVDAGAHLIALVFQVVAKPVQHDDRTFGPAG